MISSPEQGAQYRAVLDRMMLARFGPGRGAWAVVLIVALALVSGCASRAPAEDDRPYAPLPADLQAETSPLARINPDVIYYVGAAEILGQRELYQDSAEYYRKAAQISEDPRIAARAVKVAAFVNDENLTLDGVQRWIELDPADPEPHRYAAILFLRRGDAEPAWDHISTILEHADNPEGWQAIAKLLASSPEPDASRLVFERLMQREGGLPEDRETYGAFGDLAAQLGELETAESLASASLELEEDAGTYNWRARIRHSLDRLEDARADFARAVELAPDEQGYRQSYAALLAEMEDYEGALTQLEKVEPTAAIAYSKALYAQAAEDDERAQRYMAELEALPAEDPNQKQFLLGQLAEALERPAAEAISYYRKVQAGDRLDDAKLRIAMVLARSGEMDQARTVLRALQNGNAATAGRAYLAEAAVLREAGQDEQAMATYNRALQFLPEDVDLLFARALYAEQLDQIDQAEADLRRVLELRPDDPNALNALGYTLADRTDRFDEALGLIERAYAQMPEEAAVVDSMGWVHFKLGNLEQALEHLQHAFDLETDPEIAAHLGEVLWQLGRHDEARAAWNKVLQDDPDAEVVLETRARLTAE